MNREERRHPQKIAQTKQLISTMSEIQKYKDAIEGDWPLKAGDKVQLNLDAIVNRQGYTKTLPAYQKFCEENAGKTFTVEYDKNLRQSLVCLAEDTTKPKWLFWIGDLTKVRSERCGVHVQAGNRTANN